MAARTGGTDSLAAAVLILGGPLLFLAITAGRALMRPMPHWLPGATLLAAAAIVLTAATAQAYSRRRRGKADR
jgi:hypothetical protein